MVIPSLIALTEWEVLSMVFNGCKIIPAHVCSEPHLCTSILRVSCLLIQWFSIPLPEFQGVLRSADHSPSEGGGACPCMSSVVPDAWRKCQVQHGTRQDVGAVGFLVTGARRVARRRPLCTTWESRCWHTLSHIRPNNLSAHTPARPVWSALERNTSQSGNT